MKKFIHYGFSIIFFSLLYETNISASASAAAVGVSIAEMPEAGPPIGGVAYVPVDAPRREIINIADFPYSAHGLLQIELEDKTYIGTGVLVGPQHVLTAGHNLFFRKYNAIADMVSFSLGYDDGFSISHHDGKDNRIVPHKQYVAAKSEKDAQQYDIGMLILKEQVSQPFVEVQSIADEHIFLSAPISVVGYPDINTLRMYRMNGTIIDRDLNKVVYNVDTAKGVSGGCGFTNTHGPYLSVHTHGAPSSGVLITEEIRKWINSIMEKVSPKT